MRLRLLVAPVLLTSLLAPLARACPVCDSPVADEVRSAIADDINSRTLAAIAMPFAVVAGVVSLIHFGVPSFRRKP